VCRECRVQVIASEDKELRERESTENKQSAVAHPRSKRFINSELI